VWFLQEMSPSRKAGISDVERHKIQICICFFRLDYGDFCDFVVDLFLIVLLLRTKFFQVATSPSWDEDQSWAI
jgi:hypothetical protein